MSLDAQHGWKREGIVTAGDILASLRTEFELTLDAQERGLASAERWLVDGGRTASTSSPLSPARSAAPATVPG
jgi:cyclic pyranopterin phosphate synthase